MIGGFQAVADVLNANYTWPDDRTVTRQAVEAWHRRRTLNKSGFEPPAPVDAPYRATSPGRPPTYQFDPKQWEKWAGHGVPGRRNSGWVVPLPRD